MSESNGESPKIINVKPEDVRLQGEPSFQMRPTDEVLAESKAKLKSESKPKGFKKLLIRAGIAAGLITVGTATLQHGAYDEGIQDQTNSQEATARAQENSKENNPFIGKPVENLAIDDGHGGRMLINGEAYAEGEDEPQKLFYYVAPTGESVQWTLPDGTAVKPNEYGLDGNTTFTAHPVYAQPNGKGEEIFTRNGITARVSPVWERTVEKDGQTISLHAPINELTPAEPQPVVKLEINN